MFQRRAGFEGASLPRLPSARPTPELHHQRLEGTFWARDSGYASENINLISNVLMSGGALEGGAKAGVKTGYDGGG